MVSARDVDQGLLVDKLAEKLDGEIQMPEWAEFVKTGVHKERPPEDDKWWFQRSASVLRKIYMEGPVGVSKLRSFYGGRKNMGHQPAHFKKGGGKILRVVMQELEKLGYVEKVEKGIRGRKITAKGQKFVDSAAKNVK